MKDNMFRVWHTNYYDNLFANIVVGTIENLKVTEEEAARMFDDTEIYLTEDGLRLICNGQIRYITDLDRGAYLFEIVTKVQPPPIVPGTLSHTDIMNLLENKDYMLEEKDFLKVPWTITETYRRMKEMYPHKKEFRLDSSGYRVEIVSSPLEAKEQGFLEIVKHVEQKLSDKANLEVIHSDSVALLMMWYVNCQGEPIWMNLCVRARGDYELNVLDRDQNELRCKDFQDPIDVINTIEDVLRTSQGPTGIAAFTQ
ncbi:hypothetical protein [Paenibacillus jiagnxiensis]|uniref:hypothetical protein n=1 Tax=Paenibacillus jiagnxiensis TaxID=3228926 RepID=UPI0033AFE5F6